MSQIALLQCFMLVAALLCATLLRGCSDGRSPAERVRAFCDGVRVGEPFVEAEARYLAYRLQPGGFAPDPKERLVSRRLPTFGATMALRFVAFAGSSSCSAVN